MLKLSSMFLIIIPIIILAIYSFLDYSNKFENNKFFVAFLYVYNILGIVSLTFQLFLFRYMPYGIFKKGILIISSYYFVSLFFSSIINIFIHLIYFFFLRKRSKNNFVKKKYISMIIYFIVVFIFVIGFKRIDDLKLTKYDIKVEKVCKDKNVKIAFVSDLHIGAGANFYVIDKMVNMINENNVDFLVIGGDIVDDMSSNDDIQYLVSSLEKINTTNGIYLIEGNHDKDSLYDLKKLINNENIKYLCDEVVMFDNGINLVGEKDKTKYKITDFIKKYNINEKYPILCLRHRPNDYFNIKDKVDLVMSGHTHGVRYPYNKFIDWVQYDHVYGLKKFGNMFAVITSGISAWGIHFKYPAISEVVILNLSFNKNLDKS